MGIVILLVGAVGCVEVRIVLLDALGQLAYTRQGEAALLLANQLAETLIQNEVDVHLVGSYSLGLGTGAQHVDVGCSLGLLTQIYICLGTQQIGFGQTEEILIGESLTTGSCQLVGGLVLILGIGIVEWCGHLGRVAAHKAVRQLVGGIYTAVETCGHRVASGQYGVLKVEIAIRHGSCQLRTVGQHVGAMNLETARPVEL